MGLLGCSEKRSASSRRPSGLRLSLLCAAYVDRFCCVCPCLVLSRAATCPPHYHTTRNPHTTTPSPTTASRQGHEADSSKWKEIWSGKLSTAGPGEVELPGEGVLLLVGERKGFLLHSPLSATKIALSEPGRGAHNKGLPSSCTRMGMRAPC